MVDVEELRKQVLKNAYLHDGKADLKSVMSKILGEHPELRRDPKSTIQVLKDLIEEINSIGKEKLEEIVTSKYPEFTIKEKRVQEHRLPDLDNVVGEVAMRLAPSPSGPLHLGHSRMSILNDEYVKRYGGKLYLRLEDTNPANIDPDAYEMIPEDLEWLGVDITEIVIQSERFEKYYSEARKLIENGKMYVCECDPEEFRKMKVHSIACPDRDLPVETNLERFQRMVDGEYEPGKAVAVVKTDLSHPNPSVRDWIAFRISNERHPRAGDKYSAFPLMSFSVAVDDHLLKLTHVIRGKDQLSNTEKQRYIFEYNNWKKPEYYHYGMISIPNTILKTSIIKKGIKSGEYKGWDDVRLGTLRALKRRGYAPETFRRYWIESGMRESDAEFSWEIFNSMNKENIDSKAKRFFFVPKQVQISLKESPSMESKAPYHPGNKELGFRSYKLEQNAKVFVSENDWQNLQDGDKIRLKDLCNIVKEGRFGLFLEDQKTTQGLKIIQWCPDGSHQFEVFRPDGQVDDGLVEPLIKGVSGVVQLERYGYVNVDRDSKRGYFLHR